MGRSGFFSVFIKILILVLFLNFWLGLVSFYSIELRVQGSWPYYVIFMALCLRDRCSNFVALCLST